MPQASLNTLSLSTVKQTPQLPKLESNTARTTPFSPSNSTSVAPDTSSHLIEHPPLPFSPPKSPGTNGKSVSFAGAASGDGAFGWDLEELNQFTREIFKRSMGNKTISFHEESIGISSSGFQPMSRSLLFDRLVFIWDGRSSETTLLADLMDRYISVKNEDEDLNRYISSRSQCLDEFEEYINSLKRQHGIIRPASVDPPIFEPNISVSRRHSLSDEDLRKSSFN